MALADGLYLSRDRPFDLLPDPRVPRPPHRAGHGPGAGRARNPPRPRLADEDHPAPGHRRAAPPRQGPQDRHPVRYLQRPHPAAARCRGPLHPHQVRLGPDDEGDGLCRRPRHRLHGGGLLSRLAGGALFHRRRALRPTARVHGRGADAHLRDDVAVRPLRAAADVPPAAAPHQCLPPAARPARPGRRSAALGVDRRHRRRLWPHGPHPCPVDLHILSGSWSSPFSTSGPGRPPGS